VTHGRSTVEPLQLLYSAFDATAYSDNNPLIDAIIQCLPTFLYSQKSLKSSVINTMKSFDDNLNFYFFFVNIYLSDILFSK